MILLIKGLKYIFTKCYGESLHNYFIFKFLVIFSIIGLP